MNINSISFPYPVLGHFDDFTIKINPFTDQHIKWTISENKYQFEIHFPDCGCPEISNLIGKHASYVCEVDCVRTNFRKSYRSNSNIIEFSINTTDIAEKVVFSLGIVVTEDFSGYSSTNFNPIYPQGIDMEKGYILASYGQLVFNLEVVKAQWKGLGDFVKVRKDKDAVDDYPRCNISGNVIYIDMSPKMYDAFCQFNISIGNHSFMHSSLVISALCKALREMNEQNWWGDCDRPHLWADFLANIVRSDYEANPKSYKGFSFDAGLSEDQIELLCHKILKNPFGRMFDDNFNKGTE